MKTRTLRIRTVLAVTLFTGALVTVALAHNALVKTEPAANAVLKASPAHVEMWFAEKPDLTVSKITATGPSGAVDMGAVRANSEKSIAADFKGKLADGQYTVSWQTAGDDSHVSKGEFKFSVKASQ